MYLSKALSNLFCEDFADQDVNREKFGAYSQQIPVAYLSILINMGIGAIVFADQAPFALTVLIPGVTVIFCAYQLSALVKTAPSDDHPQFYTLWLKKSSIIGFGIGIVYGLWTFALYQYGDLASRAFIVFLAGMTGLYSMLYLIYMRAVAMRVALFLGLADGLFCLMSQERVILALGFAFMVGSLICAIIVQRHSEYFVKMVRAHTQARQLSDENFRLANQDVLTGLPNRRRFFSCLAEAILEAKANRSAFGVGVMDLNGFKSVNDLYGHSVGDLLLEEAARRLSGLECQSMFIARLGGDEFAFILKDNQEAALALAHKITQAVNEPFCIAGIMIELTTSLGVAFYPEHAVTAEQLFEYADAALYRSKDCGNGQPILFNEDLRNALHRSVAIETRLREANFEKDFYLQFQPLYDAITRQPVAFEALARWRAPDIGLVSPDVFIAVAERTDLIRKLTQCLLRMALAEASLWPQRIRLAFNLSIHDLMSSESILQIIAIINSSGVSPDRIDLEITETAVIKNFDKASQALTILKNLGVRIALDDFGTGYSNLNYIHKLPFDIIKIDRTFVREIASDHGSNSIVRTMIDLCRHLDAECVTEGVETQDQAALLQKLGCHAMQGFYFNRPMDRTAARALAWSVIREEKKQMTAGH